MNYIIAIGFVFLAIQLLRSLLFNVYLWQLKEYRFDRMRTHCFQTQQGKWTLFYPLKYFKLLLLLISSLLSVHFILYGFIVIYTFEFIFFVKKLLTHQILRPIFTSKVIAILISTFLIIFVLTPFSINFNPDLLFWMIIDLLIPFFVTLLIFIINPASKIIKRKYILLATEKMKKNKNLKVIGITGSYGKTTTKEYLYTILSKKFNVLKTPKNTNTEIGVAKTVMDELNEDYEIFIVEMGAYKKGEISDICKIVSPQIGVLTGIGNQHLALFKSIGNIISTKFELIDSLPNYGIAILNGDNQHILDRKETVKCKKIIYSTQSKTDVSSQDIRINGSDITFDLDYSKGKENISFNALGTYNVSNLLAAISVALELGMNIEEIKERIVDIHPQGQVMKPYKGINNSLIIDDTYNANTDGVLLSIQYLSNYSGNKILVISNVLELGVKAIDDHIKIGKMAGVTVDYVFITQKDYSKYIVEGLLQVEFNKNHIFIDTDYDNIAKKVKSLLSNQDIILLEGRGPGRLLNHLKV